MTALNESSNTILQHNTLILDDYQTETQTSSEMLMGLDSPLTALKVGIIPIYTEYVYHHRW